MNTIRVLLFKGNFCKVMEQLNFMADKAGKLTIGEIKEHMEAQIGKRN
jgi:hypothetical protein